MKSYTAHLKPGRLPVLVKEGWSWGAFFFGPLWFAAKQAWIPAAIHAALLIVVAIAPARIAPPPVRLILVTALAILAGLLARDLLRWSLDRRGYLLTHVLAARDHDSALGRLLAARPDLASGLAALLR